MSAVRVATIDDAARAKIAALVGYAVAHPLTEAAIRGTMAGTVAPIGDDPMHVITISDVYRCCFSIEWQPHGMARHLSISIVNPNPKRPMPSVEAVQVLASEFGFVGRIPDAFPRGTMYLEDVVGAVNLVQYLDG